eukprot:XP_011669585.1 PREDICTED: cell wall integrity and stress response component 4-like [Strongylocentrotus purpuratus]
MMAMRIENGPLFAELTDSLQHYMCIPRQVSIATLTTYSSGDDAGSTGVLTDVSALDPSLPSIRLPSSVTMTVTQETTSSTVAFGDPTSSSTSLTTSSGITTVDTPTQVSTSVKPATTKPANPAPNDSEAEDD